MHPPRRIGWLWHLHQPDVRDPFEARFAMPWPRLHAWRGYTDLVEETLRYGTLWTLNFTDSLVEQLEDLATGGSDPLWDAVCRPAEALAGPELRELVRWLTVGHDAMWTGLEARRGLAREAEVLSKEDVRSLQASTLVAWCGSEARTRLPRLDALRAQGGHASADDLTELISLAETLVEALPRRIRALGASPCGLAASPSHHPILPLLIDTGHASRCLPGVEDVGYRWPEDAARALVAGRSRVEGAVGREVRVLWPSEGAVSPEALALAAQAGFRVALTDEGLLERSLHEGPWGAGPWTTPSGVDLRFRNRAASDRVSFHAAGRDVDEVLAALVADLRSPYDVVALDGENPWESFPDAGAALRDGLRRTFEGCWERFDEAREPIGQIRALATGSWIRADLAVWYGDEADRAVWRALVPLRRRIDALDGPARDAALRRLAPALASDFTWWTGSEHPTPFAPDFEALFAARLAALRQVVEDLPDGAAP